MVHQVDQLVQDGEAGLGGDWALVEGAYVLQHAGLVQGLELTQNQVFILAFRDYPNIHSANSCPHRIV